MNLTIREFFERYGATTAILVALVLLFAVFPGNAGTNSASDVAATAPVAGNGTPGAAPGSTVAGGRVTSAAGNPGSTAGGANPSGGGSGPGPAGVERQPAPAAGQTAWNSSHGPGNYPAPTTDTPCREDGALPGLHASTPPCVPVFDGDNGGSTHQGVTATEIKIIRYVAPDNPATQAALTAIGGADSPEVQDRTDNAFMRYFATHYETYGREPVYEKYHAVDDSEEAQRADAVTIAEELKPFAVWGAPTVTAEELAHRGVVCICTVSQTRDFYTRNFPYIWGSLPELDLYYEHIAEYIGKRLWGRPAKWAGTNVRVSNDVRKFGLIYLEGTPERIDPGAEAQKNYFQSLLAGYGAKLEVTVGYIFDIQQQQQQSTNIMAQMVSAGVNNIIIIGDPLYPIFLTNEATKQQYYPEWFITGTALIDTTFFGRTYDKAQWAHAFGISPLWLFFSRVETSSGYGAVHHMIEGLPSGMQGEGVQVNVRQAPIQQLITGIYWAGPNLTPETFGAGMLARPPTGGVPKEPLVYYTAESPVSIKDFTEVWWNPSGSGTDETSNNGVGTLMKANRGERYALGAWSAVDAFVFGDDPAPLYTSDEPAEIRPHGVEGHHHTVDPATDPCRSCPGGMEAQRGRHY
ncbi:MAG TPA: hypothetical protein VM262_10940 [Acidimicrobiales bacterium]|nr:hypothetical protein [Acidimicrobiales bacterium]